MDNIEIISKLILLTQKKEEYLGEMLRLTTVQRILIKGEALDKLAETIENKQRLIEEIQDLDIEFLKHYTGIKNSLNIRSIEEIDVKEYPHLKELKLHIQNTLELLNKIDALDKENKEKLSAEFEKVKEEMKKTKLKQQSTKLATTYQKKYLGGQGAFVDNKKE